MTLTNDMVAMCAAIDAGDHSVVPILADCLEDLGDPATAGLREIISLGLRPTGRSGESVWFKKQRKSWSPGPRLQYATVCTYPGFPPQLLELAHRRDTRLWRDVGKYHISISAAYLALAEAIAEAIADA